MLLNDRAGMLPAHRNMLRNIETETSTIYLGAHIHGDCEAEIKRRIGIAKTSMAKLTKLWKDHKLTKLTQLRLVNSRIFPIMRYGLETWPIKAADAVGDESRVSK